jgi:hypothetical protein
MRTRAVHRAPTTVHKRCTIRLGITLGRSSRRPQPPAYMDHVTDHFVSCDDGYVYSWTGTSFGAGGSWEWYITNCPDGENGVVSIAYSRQGPNSVHANGARGARDSSGSGVADCSPVSRPPTAAPGGSACCTAPAPRGSAKYCVIAALGLSADRL